MKLSRRHLLAAGAASFAAGTQAARQPTPRAHSQTPERPVSRRIHPPNLPIRDYLSAEARRITEKALADLKTKPEFTRHVGNKRRQFIEMMGLAEVAGAGRPPVKYTITGVVDRPAYRIHKLHYESLPNLHVTANLYLPKSATTDAPRPGVLYVCGHMQNQKVHYQAHPKRFAELGFPTLITETVQLGEAPGYHHGCYREGWFHWYSRGYSPAAIELLNGIRGLDLLASRPEVDVERLGVTGISGGGATTWWVAAADERVKACSPVCATATVESHIYDRVIDGHCDCMWWVNTGLWDLADVGALIAPRPLLIASANQDGIFPIHSIRRVHSQLRSLYAMLGKPEHLRFVETPGGHSYHEHSRTAIFSWFLEHLAQKHVPAPEVGDIELDEGKLESVDTLRVYDRARPAGDRTPTIHDELIKLASPPSLGRPAEVPPARDQVVAALRHDTFNHFPRNPPPLAVAEEFALDGGTGTRFAFTSEEGWRLHGIRRNPRNVRGATAALLVLRSPGEERTDSDTFAARIEGPWTKLIVATRGTGDTSWGDDLNWHVRRASAWIGRTIASMRVWDTLRALEAARSLPGLDGSQLAIAARGEMAAVALYAALLDGGVTSLFLDSPPASQNAPSEPSGRGPAIEMLNCLRYTDLAYVAGLLYPAEITLYGEIPSSYGWTEDVYNQLGSAGLFKRATASTPRS